MVHPEGPPAWRVSALVPFRALAAFEDTFAEDFTTVSTFEVEEDEVWVVEGFAAKKPDTRPLALRLALLASAMGIQEPALELERLPETDWLAASYRSFPPIRIGRFFIHGSHVEGGVPASAIGLRIDAATAFGSGEHPTTEGCLRAIERLGKKVPVARALDMGCGTGILAFAAARVWGASVLAADVDPESVRVARINARANRVGDRVRAIVSDGYAGREAPRAGPYDLILANILARPLTKMAPDLAGNLKPGGFAILSGLLSWQETQVRNAHRACGLTLADRITIKGWTTLVLRKRRAD